MKISTIGIITTFCQYLTTNSMSPRPAVSTPAPHTALFLLAAAALFVMPAPALSADFEVTSTSCEGPGSLTEAVEMANSSPGTDTITFTSGLQVNTQPCFDLLKNKPNELYVAKVTDSVVIEGNGGTVYGYQAWVNDNGSVNATNDCPSTETDLKTILVGVAPGFLRVGSPTQSNTGLSVTVRNLTVHDQESLALVGPDASLELDGIRAYNIQPILNCFKPAVEVLAGGNLKIKNNNWDRVYEWGALFGAFLAETAPIYGAFGAGNLEIEDSLFVDLNNVGGLESPLISWNGGAGSTMRIVSSQMLSSGGIFAGEEVTTDIVNSVWAADLIADPAPALRDRIVNSSSGDFNITASTFLYQGLDCGPTCQAEGYPGWIRAYNSTGHINFRESVVGVVYPDAGGVPYSPLLQEVNSPGAFTADEFTGIQPVTDQDAAALKDITGQPNLLTDPPGLPVNLDSNPLSVADSVTPLTGTIGDPGKLINAVGDPTCSVAGASGNLLSPIDSQPIATDVYGHPRCDATSDRRNSGAVQNAPTPYLSVVSTVDGTVTVAWNRTPDPSPALPTMGYAVFYGPAGSSVPFTRVDVSGPDTVTEQITALTNGTEYEFEVVAVTSGGDGPPSNLVKATPYGLIEPPEVTAEPGDGEVQLFWSEPNAGGHPGPLFYTVVYRPVGTAEWTPGPNFLSARTTIIPGLKNGTEYEIGVYATATDGVASEIGLAKATPHGDIGTVNRTPDEQLPAGSAQNTSEWWQHEGYGTACTKYELPEDFGSVWDLEGGASALILKSGFVNDVWRAPNIGQYGTASAKDISHAIVCFGMR